MVKPREPQTIERRCGLCESFCETDVENGSGECRNDPPTLFSDGGWGWPPTHRNWWCGSFISRGPNHPNLTIYPA